MTPQDAAATFGPLLDPAGVRPVSRLERPSCSLYRFETASGRQVVVKVRRATPVVRAGADRGRPALHPAIDLGPERKAVLEHRGLAAVDDALQASGDPGSMRLRALFVDESHRAFGMDHLPHPTLKWQMTTRARRRSGRSSELLTETVRNAGRWLAAYHSLALGAGGPGRATSAAATPSDVTSLLVAFGRYLADQGLPAPHARAIAGAADQLGPHLSAAFPIRARHGDFAPRNILVDPAGRVAGLDPMPAWDAPVHEDVATMLHHLRMPARPSAAGSAWMRSARQQQLERAFVDAYFGGAPVPEADLAAFRLLALADHWAGIASRVRGIPVRDRMRPWLRSQWLRSGYGVELRRQAEAIRRLVDVGGRSSSAST